MQIWGKIIDTNAEQFSKAASTYDSAAVVEQEVGQRLLERLAHIKINPKVILDLGCGTGYFAPQLQKLFPHAKIIGLDFAMGMLKIAKHKSTVVCANAAKLPLANHSIDLVFANCCLPHVHDVPLTLTEIKRVLHQQGAFLFTSYGPATLQELGMANHWPDMHNTGDLLLELQFKDPVVDNEIIRFDYAKLQDLLDDLQQTGAYEVDTSAIDDLQQSITATYEIVYGHAWGQAEVSSTKCATDTFYIEVTR